MLSNTESCFSGFLPPVRICLFVSYHPAWSLFRQIPSWIWVRDLGILCPRNTPVQLIAKCNGITTYRKKPIPTWANLTVQPFGHDMNKHNLKDTKLFLMVVVSQIQNPEIIANQRSYESEDWGGGIRGNVLGRPQFVSTAKCPMRPILSCAPFTPQRFNDTSNHWIKCSKYVHINQAKLQLTHTQLEGKATISAIGSLAGRSRRC